MKRKFLGLALGVCMMSSAVTPVMAAGGTKSSEVTIEAKATTVNVTVPATAPFVFNEDGTNTTPSNFTIRNNSSIAGINLDSISLDADSTDWQLADNDYDLTSVPKDTKTIKLKIGKIGEEKLVAPTSGDTSKTGTVTYSDSDFTLDANTEENLNFVVERGAFTEAISNAKAFSMTLVFDFN